MGTFECVRQVRALSVDAKITTDILGGLAQKLLAPAGDKAHPIVT